MKNRLVGLFIIVLVVFSIIPEKASAQKFLGKLNSFYLNLKYKGVHAEPEYGVSVLVQSEDGKEKIYSTSGNDSVQGLDFQFDKRYTLTIYKEKYFNLKIIVDTYFKEKQGKLKFNKDKTGQVKLNYNMDLIIPLCLLSGRISTDSIGKAQARIYFDQATNQFVLDSNYRITKENYSVSKMCSILLKTQEEEVKYVDYNAKLLYGKQKTLLIDQGLNLKDSKGMVIQSTKTDVYGDFSFKKIDARNDFNVVLDKNDKLPYGEHVYLSDSKGVISKEITMDSDNDLAFDLLSSDLMELTESSADENVSRLQQFKSGNEKELTITENILYAPGEWHVPADHLKQLMHMIQTLQQNASFKIEIYSYTDAVGDAQANMELSNKRAKAMADLFISKGVKPERIKWKGFGETKILNRCVDGVECSEKENQVNRRTEFKFLKE